MRKQPSQGERAVWEIVRNNRLGFKFRRQRPIGRYIADFACMEAKLIIEIDGSSHDIADQISYDAERTSRLNALGWRVLRLRDALVLSDPSAAAAVIVEALRQPLTLTLSPPGERERRRTHRPS